MRFINKKRILSLCMSVAMFSSMLPFNTYAQEEEQVITEEDSIVEIEENNVAETVNEEEPVLTFVDTDYKFDINITGDTDTKVAAGSQINFLNNTGLDFTRADGEALSDAEADNYQLRIQSVSSTESGYVWDRSTLIVAGAEGTVYTVKFGVYNLESNAFVEESDNPGYPITSSRTYTVSNEVHIYEAIDGQDAQYISYGAIRKYIDGTETFDADNAPGNDAGDNNRIVRTFDTITYTMAVRSESYVENTYYKDGYVGFEIYIPYEEHELKFDVDSMGWMVRDEVAGSLTEKFNYKIEDVTVSGQPGQKLTAYRHLNADAQGVKTVFPIADMELNLTLKVQTMANGDIIDPTIYTWVDGNDAPNNPGYTCTRDASHAKAKNAGKETYEIPVEEIVVSAAPKYNVMIDQQTGELYVAEGMHTYDFTTGNAKALNKDAGTVNGLTASYGITIQLYQDVPGKGLKGIEIPQGDITFDVTLEARYDYTDSEGQNQSVNLHDQSAYRPLVWTYEGNKARSGQTDGRALDYATDHAVTIAPYNTNVTKAKAQTGTAEFKTSRSTAATSNCWYGGDWNATQNGNVVSFTISDYVINPNWFPQSDSDVNNQDYYTIGNDPQTTDIGCFSAGELFVVYPIGKDEKELPTKYGNGTFNVTATDGKLKATSISGQSIAAATSSKDNSNQVKKTDDVVQRALPLEASTPGTYNYKINYTNNVNAGGLYDWNGLYYTTSGECARTANDRSLKGQDGAISAYIEAREWRIDKNYVYAANIMIKFDDKAFIPNGKTNGVMSGFNKKVLWVAKADKNGWASNQEMNEAKINDEDFVYFESLDDLQNSGYTAVAAIAEFRWNNPETVKTVTGQSTTYHFIIYGKAADDVETGYVAQTVIAHEYWTKNEYDAAKEDGYNDKKSGYELVIPSYMTTKTLPKSSGAAAPDNYRNAEYDANGVCTYQNTMSGKGDSLYIEDYKTKISTTTLQQLLSGSRKEMFALDDNQNQVDLAIDWGMELATDTLTGKKTTTVTITDTVPAGTAFNDDLVLGGDFVLDNPNGAGYKGTVTGGTKVGETFIYKDPFNGQETEIKFASLSKDVDGSGNTTLKIVLENVPVTASNFPDFYYSVTIDKAAAKNGQQYKSTASIQSLEDLRDPYKAYGNYSETGFSVSKNAALAIVKTVDKMFLDNGTQATYTSTWENTAANAQPNSLMMDTMPYNSDPRGSKYNGYYTLDGIQLIDNNGTNDYTGLKFYYTTDASVKDQSASDWKDSISDIENGTKGWTSATVEADGSVSLSASLLTGENKITAWCIIGDLLAGKMVRANCMITPVDCNPNDRFTNQISMLESEGTATVYIVDRQVSGLVWIDADRDGRRQYTEDLVKDVNVRLVEKSDYETNGFNAATVNNLFDEPCTMKTDAKGEYSFKHLAQGEYVVLFSDSGSVLKEYRVTDQKKSGVPEAYNSDAAEVLNSDSILTGGYITGVTMPSVDKITASPYVVSNLDMGLVSVTVDIDVEKVWKDSNTIRPDQVVIHLLADKEDTGEKLVLKDGNWTGSFKDLKKYKNGKEIKYTISEDTPNGYKAVIKNKTENDVVKENSFIVTNYETTSVSGKKQWNDADNQDGLRPDSITVNLLANKQKVADTTVSGDKWEFKFDNLAKYDDDNKLIEYTVTEEKVDNYPIVRITGDATDGFVIENTHNPEKTKVSGEKKWKNDVEANRPAKIIIHLWRNGKDIDQQEVTGPDWKYSFDNLDKYEKGKLITYTITEETVDNYVTTYEGNDVINTFKNDKTSVTVAKVWMDGGNIDKIRPDKVEVKLLADGKDTGKTLILNDKNSWKATFTDLDAYNAGKKITYTIEEIKVSGYTVSIAGDMKDGFVITNTHTPKTPNTGTKNNIMFWSGMSLLSAAGIFMLLMIKKKSEA